MTKETFMMSSWVRNRGNFKQKSIHKIVAEKAYFGWVSNILTAGYKSQRVDCSRNFLQECANSSLTPLLLLMKRDATTSPGQ